MSTPVPKIAIIGAGPAGLLLGNILQLNSVPFQIFEASATSRNSGGSLDIHPRDGQAALREAVLWEDFVARARPESDVMKVVNPAGKVLWDGNTVDKREVREDEKFNHRPEIDRGDLMQVLLGRLRPDAIRWSCKLNRVETVPGSAAVAGQQTTTTTTTTKYDLVFADGASERGFDMVIGADGAWSKVRKLLTAEMPSYSGVSGVSFNLADAARTNPWADEMAGAGSCFSFGEGRAIMAQRQGTGAIWSYGWLRVPENWASELAPREAGIDWDRPAEARDRMIDAYFADYAPDMVRLLRDSEPDGGSGGGGIVRLLYHLPVGFRWDHAPGTEAVTLLGDAAHVMTPFAGVGVNAALADAHQLARGILNFLGKGEHQEEEGMAEKQARSLADVVALYEEDMFPRAKEFATKTARGLKNHFAADGSEEFAERLRAH